MKELTCVVVGGGFAGIHAIKAIRKEHRQQGDSRKLRLVLIDRQPEHLRKVLLFQPAAGGQRITVPWRSVLPEEAQFVQGSALDVESEDKRLKYADSEGSIRWIDYDILVLAIGSVARQATAEQGGIALDGLEAAGRIRQRWQTNMKLAAAETNAEERRRLLTAAVAGAGITGIETAAELAHAMRLEAPRFGIDPAEVTVHLLNSQERLFLEGPAKAGLKLEQDLAEVGVTVHHRSRAVREEGGKLLLHAGVPLAVGLTVWTLGLVANPALRDMALPLTEDGQVIVDESYRVSGSHRVYCIGDCARIIDPESGKADRMTCKEAIPQAQRLGGIIFDDLSGRPAQRHKPAIDSYTVALGPGRGLLWTRKWGLDFIITGKLAYRIKTLLWDNASLLRL